MNYELMYNISGIACKYRQEQYLQVETMDYPRRLKKKLQRARAEIAENNMWALLAKKPVNETLIINIDDNRRPVSYPISVQL